MSVWTEVLDWLEDLVEDTWADVKALVRAEAKYAKDYFTPQLVIAAKEGYNAAENSDLKGLDKLNLAATTAMNLLTASGVEFVFGAVVTACQAVWTQQQINDAEDAAKEG